MTDLSGDYDAQDLAEVFDEDNVNLDGDGVIGGEMLTFENMPDVLDVTCAIGDSDDDAALIGEELDDDEIIALELDADLADFEDDESAGRTPEQAGNEALGLFDPDDIADDAALDDAGTPSEGPSLRFMEDVDPVTDEHHRGAARMESRRELDDDDLEDLGYRDADGPR